MAAKSKVRKILDNTRRLYAKGKSRQATITAIARELSGFIWAIDQEVQQEMA